MLHMLALVHIRYYRGFKASLTGHFGSSARFGPLTVNYIYSQTFSHVLNIILDRFPMFQTTMGSVHFTMTIQIHLKKIDLR